MSHWHTKQISLGLARVLKKSVFTLYEVTEEGLCLAVFLFRQWSLDYGNSAGREIRESFQREILCGQCELSLGQWDYLMPLFIFPAFRILL